MSRTRTNSPIEDVDRIAREEGLTGLEEGGDCRRFRAFSREFVIKEAPAGKVGIFAVTSTPVGEAAEEAGYEGMETHDSIRRLFRRAVKWKERVP